MAKTPSNAAQRGAIARPSQSTQPILAPRISFAERASGMAQKADDLGIIGGERGRSIMGGPGSGNHYHWWRGGKKTTVEECLSIDANRWTREGIFRAGAGHTGRWLWKYAGGRECSIGYEVLTGGAVPFAVRLSSTSDRNG